MERDKDTVNVTYRKRLNLVLEFCLSESFYEASEAFLHLLRLEHYFVVDDR